MSDLERLRHSCAHVLATAIMRIWPDAQLAGGPPVDNGFYYDMELKHRITPDDFARLADNPRFQAIKESAADTRRFGEIRQRVGDRFALFCGVDDLALECFALGAVGWVAGLVVAFPRETVSLWKLCQAGRWDEARALYDWFLPLLHLDIGPKFVQQIKLVEALMGVGSAKVRAPRLQLTEVEASAVEKILSEALEQRPQIL